MLGRLEAIAAKASWILWSHFKDGKGLEIVARRGDDVTRAVDAQMEEYIYTALRGAFEGGVLIAEEGGIYRWGDERYVFVLDPLDGSLNYSLGIPVFTISIAAGRNRTGKLDDLEYAVLAVPSTGEIYSLGPGSPPSKNGAPLKRAEAAANVAFVAMGESVPHEVYSLISSMGLKGRSLGCSSYELLLTGLGAAVGFADLRGKLRMLDVAAALLIGRALGMEYIILGDYSLEARGISLLAGTREFVDGLGRGLGRRG
ncbi:MAG: inositol monophosphatase family protein [Thermoproteus sp.]